MKICFLSYFVLVVCMCRAQTPVLYSINSSGTVNLVNGYHIGKAEEINIGDASYNISSTAEVYNIAAKQIYVQPGFSVDNLSGNGVAELYIDPDLTVVGSFHPNGFSNIPQYSRFEIGIRPPEAILKEIANYFNNSTFWTPGTKLNPYDPEELRVECEYELIGVPGTYLRHGFFSHKTITAVISGSTDIWQENSFVNPTSPYMPFGGYLFRMRFAPPNVGVYKGTVRLYRHGVLLHTYSEFTFNVTATGNKGHLKLTGNPQVQKMCYDNGQIFYGIGRNVPYAEFDLGVGAPPNQNVPACALIGEPYYEQKARPSTHQEHRDVILDLKSNSCNFIRIRLDRFSVPIEEKLWCNGASPSFSNLTNFSSNEKYMWEMDRTLATCESNDMKILLTIQNEMDLKIPDNNQLKDWFFNPYTLLLTGTPADLISDRNQFFTSSAIRNVYKKRLYYIEARWGYSTSIAAWEMFNEVEGMGGTTPSVTVKGTQTITEYPWDSSTSNDVAVWVCDMKDYLQSPGIYPKHLVTCGTMFQPFATTALNNNPITSCLDFFVDHVYPSEIHSGSNPAVYHDYADYTQDIQEKWFTGYWKTPITNRPHLIGEHGLGTAGEIAAMMLPSQLTFHHQIWSSIFSNGLSIALQWHSWKSNPAHSLYKPLKIFTDKINFNTLLLTDRNGPNTMHDFTSSYGPNSSTYLSETAYPVRTLWMKTADQSTVYGWTRNKTSNWMVDGYPALASDPIFIAAQPNWFSDFDDIWHYNGVVSPASTSISATDMATMLQGLQPNASYDIYIYDTWDASGGLLETKTGVTTDNNGMLKFGLDMPYDLGSSVPPKYPDYAFIAYLNPSSSARIMLFDSLAVVDSLGGAGDITPHVSSTDYDSLHTVIAGEEVSLSEEKKRDKRVDRSLAIHQRAYYDEGVYPVPSKDKIYIHYIKENWIRPEFYIVNIQGQTLQKQSDVSEGIDVGSLNNGMYIFRIKDARHEKNFKFIVQK